MRTAVFGLILAGCIVTVAGRIQYHCFFDDLKRYTLENGQVLEFCAPGLPKLPFLNKGDFQATVHPDPCFECMCDDNGLSCCECDRSRSQG